MKEKQDIPFLSICPHHDLQQHDPWRHCTEEHAVELRTFSLQGKKYGIRKNK